MFRVYGVYGCRAVTDTSPLGNVVLDSDNSSSDSVLEYPLA